MPTRTGFYAGVVLTAGRSSRMGSPKALLAYGGSTFLERIVAAFREGGCDRVVVVTGPETDEDAREIAALARQAGAEIAVNADRDSQQIESLRAALLTLREPSPDGVLMSPVDAPGTSAALVRRLIDAGRSGAPVALPVAGGRRGHPVMFGRDTLLDLAEGDLPEGARTILRRHGEAVVEIEADADALLDVDTPEDYRDLTGRDG